MKLFYIKNSITQEQFFLDSSELLSFFQSSIRDVQADTDSLVERCHAMFLTDSFSSLSFFVRCVSGTARPAMYGLCGVTLVPSGWRSVKIPKQKNTVCENTQTKIKFTNH